MLAPESCDNVWDGVGDLKYPLVSDLKHDIVKQYHVENEEGVALRGLFIIDPDGTIQHATINNAPIGRNVGETLRLLQVRTVMHYAPVVNILVDVHESFYSYYLFKEWRLLLSLQLCC